ncbi:MAG TPA: hypothetical protein IAC41_06505, partial [Candidatus Merdenecus merdavium]|nr:hypothetical protein [Candidatus Merdenecus merdavium]
MKRRVEQLINGRFEYEIPEIEFSESPIHGTMKIGKLHKGSFAIQSVKEQKIKGSVFSSDSRVSVSPVQFLGINTQITYEVDTTGLQPLDQVEGFFTISSNAGEYQLPYVFKIDRKCEDSIFDQIETLDEFKELANSNFEEAYHLFISKGFYQIVEKEREFLSLYESFSKMPVQYRDL